MILELLIFNQEIFIRIPIKTKLHFPISRFFFQNSLSVSKSLNNLLPSVFNKWFNLSLNQHNYVTSSSTQRNLIKRLYKAKRYGKYSITVSAFESWNKI